MACVIDLIVDTSALAAILLHEDDADRFLNALSKCKQPAMSAVNKAELLMVIRSRLGAIGTDKANELLSMYNFVILSVDDVCAELAVSAFEQFGKGRHPAGLNFGDCFAYAIAKQWNVPLLFKGNDFVKTDIICF